MFLVSLCRYSFPAMLRCFSSAWAKIDSLHFCLTATNRVTATTGTRRRKPRSWHTTVSKTRPLQRVRRSTPTFLFALPFWRSFVSNPTGNKVLNEVVFPKFFGDVLIPRIAQAPKECHFPIIQNSNRIHRKYRVSILDNISIVKQKIPNRCNRCGGERAEVAERQSAKLALDCGQTVTQQAATPRPGCDMLFFFALILRTSF